MKENAGFDEALKVLELSESDFQAISQMVEEEYSTKDVVIVHLENSEVKRAMDKIRAQNPEHTDLDCGAFGVSTASKEEMMSKPPIAGDDGLFKRIHDVLSRGKRAIVWHREKVTVVMGVCRS